MLSLHVDRLLSTVDATRQPRRETTLRAAVFHATSLVLHLLNTALVFLLVKSLLALAHPRTPSPAAAWADPHRVAGVAALLFGVSPLHVESVAWVSERKDVLHALFFFASLWLYVLYVGTAGRGSYGAALFAFLLALLAKGQAVTLAPTLLLVDLALARRCADACCSRSCRSSRWRCCSG